MQTVYYATSRYIRHSGNLVDLTEYRRQMAYDSGIPVRIDLPEAPLSEAKSRRSRNHRLAPALLLDYCASAAILVMTVTVIIQFLVL